MKKFKITFEVQPESQKIVMKDFITKDILLSWVALATRCKQHLKGVAIQGDRSGYVVVNDDKTDTQFVCRGEALQSAIDYASK